MEKVKGQRETKPVFREMLVIETKRKDVSLYQSGSARKTKIHTRVIKQRELVIKGLEELKD